jgi:hypothetical protein
MVLYPNISAFLLSHRRPLPVLKSLQPSILQLVKRQQFLMKAALTQRFIALFLQISTFLSIFFHLSSPNHKWPVYQVCAEPSFSCCLEQIY